MDACLLLEKPSAWRVASVVICNPLYHYVFAAPREHVAVFGSARLCGVNLNFVANVATNFVARSQICSAAVSLAACFAAWRDNKIDCA
jgi:hypothetical protein